MTNKKSLALVAGAGAGLGQALVSQFEAANYEAVGLGRSRPKSVAGRFHELDLSEAGVANAVITDLIAQHGPPEIVVHNTAELVIAPFAETTVEDFQRTWTSMVQSLVLLGQAVLQPMVRGGGGTLIVSGATASLRGGAGFSAFASAKSALRSLTQSLAQEYQPAGIHVVHVILDGIIDSERSRALHSLDHSQMMVPADIAELYLQLARQPKSTWTHELDLRPASEGF